MRERRGLEWGLMGDKCHVLDVVQGVLVTLKEIMDIPDDYEIIFMQGGATEQFTAIPLNMAKTGKADYIVTGSFAKKAAKEAEKYIDVNIAYNAVENVDNCIKTAISQGKTEGS